jgi:hypothetical protein
MSRSGYNDDCEQWALIRWRGAVNSATVGKRGQQFFRDLLAALDALPEKKLIAEELESHGCVCALGALGKARGVPMENLDPEDSASVAGAFNIAEALAREVVFENDEGGYWKETPEQRFVRVRKWVEHQIKPSKKGVTEETE